MSIRTGLLLAGLSLSGCVLSIGGGSGKTVEREVIYLPAPATMPSAPATDIATRYGAAMQITSFSDRDAVLARVAADAAAGGDTRMARLALGSMSSFSERDAASEQVAMKLAQRGMRAEAVEIARGMSSFGDRDRVLARLASQ